VTTDKYDIPLESLFDIPSKPAYVNPSLAEVKARDNGLTAVSTFSGGGGSSTGLHMAGWRIPWASEFIPAARDTYLANWGDHTYVDGRDIREVKVHDILDHTGLRPGELDLFEGSPPCSGFSLMGTKSKDWAKPGVVKPYSDGVKQRVDDLFDEWLRLVEGLQPKMVLAENVPAMLTTGRAYYDSIHARLQDMGYSPSAGIFNAMHYGAATFRKRLIIWGVRKDIGPAPRAPRRNEHGYDLRDALAGGAFTPLSEEERQAMLCDDCMNGREWHKLQPGGTSEAFAQIHRCSWNRAMPGITASGGRGAAGPMHPDECRNFHPREQAWLFGYPPDYTFTGNLTKQTERIGRSVAPPLYRAHGQNLATYLKEATANV
jgi:DNA (cytosine-5)-methyltransferase 1